MPAPIVLDLCGGTGSWSAPYAKAGYDVRIIDPVRGTGGVESYDPPDGVRIVLAAPPCTRFANSGARWKWTQHRTAFLMRQALQTVYHCLRIVAQAQPRAWALENPVGVLPQYIGPYQYTFNPSDFGDPYTKRTCIWGQHRWPEKRRVEPTEGSKMHLLPPGPDRDRLRSVTPPGFARAFFEANP
jgi:hypothetical protein